MKWEDIAVLVGCSLTVLLVFRWMWYRYPTTAKVLALLSLIAFLWVVLLDWEWWNNYFRLRWDLVK